MRHKPKVYSFDVFDTALIRRVAFPSDVFRLIAKRIAEENGAALPNGMEADFISARIEAERTAILSAQDMECTLDEIWSILRKSMPYLPSDCGPQYELDAERQVLVPNALILTKIKELRKRDRRISFISDTFLPDDFVRAELIRHGVAQIEDGFYISSSSRLTKRSGALFKELLKREKVEPREVHHIGDNLRSDVTVPSQLGIIAELHSQTQPDRWERAIIGRFAVRESSTATLAGSMRVARLNPNAKISVGINELVSRFLGPVTLIWAAWILNAARNDNAQRLYFVARDGYLVYRAACILAPQFDNIDCRYLKISRQSILLPSAANPTSAEMPWVRLPWEGLPLERLVKRVGLSWSEVASVFNSTPSMNNGSKILTTEQDWNDFWTILQRPPLLDLIRARILDCKSTALAYLEQEGLFESTSVGIVDSGWILTGQMAIQKLLNSRGSQKSIRGYYLGVKMSRQRLSETGPFRSLFIEKPADRQNLPGEYEVFRRMTLLERILGLAPHGTTLRYQIEGLSVEPVCAAVGAGHVELVREITDAVEAFCVDHGREVKNYYDDTTAKELIDTLITAWCKSPSKAAVQVLMKFRSSKDQISLLSEDDRILVEPWKLRDALRNFVPNLWHRAFGITVRMPLWPEAALMESPFLPAALIRFRAIIYGRLKSLFYKN